MPFFFIIKEKREVLREFAINRIGPLKGDIRVWRVSLNLYFVVSFSYSLLVVFTTMNIMVEPPVRQS